jgi:hypothetical protein
VGNQSRRRRVALMVVMLPVGLLLAALFSAGGGPGVATAASNVTGPTGPTGLTSSSTTSSSTTTSKSTTTTSSSTSTGVPVINCVGDLSPATATDTDPNLTNYSFHCNGQVTAYSIVVTRPGQAYNEIDDFVNTGNVIDPNTGQLSTTQSFNCQGAIPGSGFNCLIGTPATYADTWALIQGQFDTTTPFCPTLPAHAKPGTKPSQGAVAYFVVNDPTGEQVGPWIFQYSPSCPVVKPVPKTKPKPKAKKASHKSKKNTKKQSTKKNTSKKKAVKKAKV